MQVQGIEIPEPSNLKIMQVLGFEPRYALSNDGLNVARLTTPAHPHISNILVRRSLIFISIY